MAAVSWEGDFGRSEKTCGAILIPGVHATASKGLVVSLCQDCFRCDCLLCGGDIRLAPAMILYDLDFKSTSSQRHHNYLCVFQKYAQYQFRGSRTPVYDRSTSSGALLQCLVYRLYVLSA